MILARQRLQLLADQIEPAGRQQAAEIGDVVGNGGRIGNEAVERHERRQRRKQREQQVEGRAGGNQQDAILVEFFPQPPADIPPAKRRNLRRRVGVAPAVEVVAIKPFRPVLGR